MIFLKNIMCKGKYLLAVISPRLLGRNGGACMEGASLALSAIGGLGDRDCPPCRQ